MVLYINCKRCGKQIEKKGPREYCIKCRKMVDREIQEIYREKRKLNKLSEEEENDA